MLMRSTVEKECTKLKPPLQILNGKRAGIMSVADFTQDAGVSPVFLPNKCANTGKSTCQPLDFFSLTENRYSTDAIMPQFLSGCGN